ncbi:GNAT family N-acetyltransferase [Aestuariibacter sp. AA17]|uniref:GNAT family N-acetyltransferase n=1 Tax=Fluctibacter corallii TaxID=2984329 RepID=A0ABT3A3B6_9ALTE|nr:GNAT family N-acetyltransferase [Aestuariibacter sp. AA17]MCV2883173.1 GNAT family N-acetyltransferase [Aestuariibacter sp. AA17]
MYCKFHNSIAELGEAPWASLTQHYGPTLQYPFLHALEHSGSVSEKSGWRPHHLGVYSDDDLLAAMPLYIKSHSYGEYVFDFNWANAYQQHHLSYYPKLLCGVPFTPVTDERLLVTEHANLSALLPAISDAIRQTAEAHNLSSFHCNFLPENRSRQFVSNDMPQRVGVQFEWQYQHETNFDDYLNSMVSRRRKSIRKERQKLKENHISIRRLTGSQISAEAMHIFYLCYQHTYLKRSGHTGYLNQAFFTLLRENFNDNMMLVIAEENGEPIASALFLYNSKQLCGRYWGALTERDGLHFECCYYQGIEFAIEQQIPLFNPGTQGEHKILRGFRPVFSYSNHWLKHTGFHNAVTRAVSEEAEAMRQYKRDCDALLPFK